MAARHITADRIQKWLQTVQNIGPPNSFTRGYTVPTSWSLHANFPTHTHGVKSDRTPAAFPVLFFKIIHDSRLTSKQRINIPIQVKKKIKWNKEESNVHFSATEIKLNIVQNRHTESYFATRSFILFKHISNNRIHWTRLYVNLY